MTSKTWQCIEGMIIAGDLDIQQLSDHLTDLNLVAQLEWFPKSPNMVGIRVATDGDTLGILTADSSEIQSGPLLIDCIEGLASKFHAEVMIGDMGIDRLPDGVSVDNLESLEDSGGPLRVVEISATPASAVPLLAAFEGVDLADLELPSGKRALLAEIADSSGSWNFGDVPLVSLVSDGDTFQAFLIEDDDHESMITYNWGMEEIIIPGGRSDDPEAIKLAHKLVGSHPDIVAIHDAVPGIDLEGAIKSTELHNIEAVRAFITSLGLPEEVTEFLGGTRRIDQISGAVFHQARGISNAIGRSVDLLLSERQDEPNIWNTYTSVVVKYPWLPPVVAASEALIGGALVTVSRRRTANRPWLRRLGTLVGTMMMVNSVAELSLAKYVALREQRHAAETDPREN